MNADRSNRQEGGAAARRLVRGLDRASLATAMADDATPYASLVITACDPAGRPLLMISELAQHTRNLLANPRASLLFDATAGLDNPLTGARVTVLGSVEKTSEEALVTRYLTRHPDSGTYAGFADFALYQMAVTRVHMVAGFGDIRWIEGSDFLIDDDAVADLAAAEPDIIAHMNDDHGEALARCATERGDGPGGAWRMTGIDGDGFDLRLGGATARIDFGHPACSPEEVRRELAGLARKARKTGEK